MSAPLFSGASITTVPKVIPAIMRSRAGKVSFNGFGTGEYSEMSAPEFTHGSSQGEDGIGEKLRSHPLRYPEWQESHRWLSSVASVGR